jgi:enoyl-CoA hydratase/carnithine racemase
VIVGAPTAPLEVEQRDEVRWLWLNRPERRNAVDETLVAALDDAIDAAERDTATTAVVVAGRGPSFCAGADLSTLLACADEGRDPVLFLERVSGAFSRLEASPLPVVAAVHGHAVAGGLELALAADVAIAAETALIGDGHVRNGLVPGGGSSVRLPRKVGPSMARWMLLTGGLVPAPELRRAGWLHAVVADADLVEAAQAAAGRLAAAAGPAQSSIKSLLARGDGLPAEIGLRMELDAFGDHWRTAPVADALRAFLDGRAGTR